MLSRPRQPFVRRDVVDGRESMPRRCHPGGTFLRIMPLSTDDVRWVAHLARLELTDAELATMTQQLAAIVDYVDLLQRVNTDGVEPMAHAVEVHNVFRADEPAQSLPVDSALANAPDRRGSFYGVPAVLD